MDQKKEPGQSVTFDDVIHSLGPFGRYQKRVFCLMCLLPMTVSIQTIMTVFTMATPEHRCAIPELPNDTYASQGTDHELLLNLSIPWETGDNGVPTRSRCLLYQNRNSSSSLSGDQLPYRSTLACDLWVFEKSTFDSTFTEVAGLVCDKNSFHANADMIFMVGVLAGSLLVGLFSDRYGRKMALMTSLVVQLGSSIGISFVRTYPAFVALRFFIGMSNIGVFLACYVLGLELVGDEYRTVAASLLQMFWPVGMFIQTGVAYLVRDWNYLQLALSSPPLVFLLYFWAVKESPRWLASKDRTDEANAILEEVARVNGKPPPPKLKRTEAEAEVRRESLLRLFTNRTTLIRTLIIFLNWMVVTMVYYGLSLNVGNLGGSIYLNNFFSSLADLIGNAAAFIGLHKLGRKVMHCGSMILGGAACLTSMFPAMFGDDSVGWTLIVLANLGKLGAAAGFSVIYLFSAELYPTVARNSMLGACSIIARLGGIVSPYIAQLNVLVGGDLGVALPLVVFGGSALLAGFLALLLPETRNKPLPETVEDAINFGKKDMAVETEYGYPNKAFDSGKKNGYTKIP